MKHLIFIYILIISGLAAGAMAGDIPPFIDTGTISIQQINDTLKNLKTTTAPPDRIKTISALFLGLPYSKGTLQSFDGEKEHLVVDFLGLDCFTLLDYTESLRMSQDFDSFLTNLRFVRYKNGVVSYKVRNHFFTDWAQTNHIKDVTQEIGGQYAVKTDKELNVKKDGTAYVDGVAPEQREFYYIPSADMLTYNLTDHVNTGDYIGFYSKRQGLDVYHVGIAIRDGDRLMLRDASSKPNNMKVIDEDFRNYISKATGIVILRPVIIK